MKIRRFSMEEALGFEEKKFKGNLWKKKSSFEALPNLA